MSYDARLVSAISMCLAVALACCAAGAQDPPAAKDAPPSETKAAAPAATTSDPALEALVGQLAHDDWKLREKAQQELAKFGASAAPRLKALLEATKDPELRARAEGVLKEIEENDATGPTFVTLRLKDTPAALAFDELVRQAGAKLETQPPGLLQREDMPRVTLEVQRQPFWEVMRQLCAAAKVRPERSGGGKLVLAADDGSWARRPFVASGPFLVTANELYVTRGVRFGAEPPGDPPAAVAPAPPAADAPAPPPGAHPVPAELIERLRARRAGGVFGGPDEGVKDHAQLQVTALFEPKLHGMAWSVGSVAEAIDDAGRSLVLARGAEPRRRSVYGGPRAGEWENTVWLGVPDDNRKARLVRLKIPTTFTVRTGVEVFEIPDVLATKDVERNIGPTRVVIKGVTALANGQYELSINSAPSSDLQAWRAVSAASTSPGPRLLDADGRDLMRAGGSSTLNVDGHTQQIRFATDRGPPGPNGRVPARLVWELPTGVKQFTVPVEFVDLPLP